MSSSRHLPAALALALTVGAAPPSLATELLSIKVDGRMQAIAHANGVGQGIPTGQQTDPLVVWTEEGAAFEIRFDDGKLSLVPWAGGSAAAAAQADMLPDGEETRGMSDIAQAFLIEPTQRYRHGILGDDVEAGGLRVITTGGDTLDYRLKSDSVFEDRRARLVDLDSDGRDEIVVVRSYLNAGAAVALFGVSGDSIVRVDEAPAIGRPNRWLNPAGVADFDGDNLIEIAYVETPHIGGTLKLLEFDQGRLRLEHEEFGFSNHAIATREQDLAAVVDWNSDGVMDLVLPDARRTSLKVVTFSDGTFGEIASINLSGPLTMGVFALPGTDKATVVYGVGDHTLVAIRP